MIKMILMILVGQFFGGHAGDGGGDSLSLSCQFVVIVSCQFVVIVPAVLTFL